MSQFVKTDQRNLSPLPVVDGGVKLQMRKLDLTTVCPVPLMLPEARDPAKSRIKVEALIPQGSGTGDLRGRAPEKYCRKIRDPADMAQRFQDQSDRLAAAGRAAIDADIGLALKKLALRSGLRRDRGSW